METDYKKFMLEAAIKAVNDQLNAFGAFAQENPQLAVLILNIKSVVDGLNERKDWDLEEIRSVSFCDTFKSTEFQKVDVPSLYSKGDVGNKRLQNLQGILNAVEVQICAFQHFSYNNLRLSVLCKNIHDILEKHTNDKLEPENDSELLKIKILTEEDAIRAVRALDVNNALYVKKEKSEPPVPQAKDGSKMVPQQRVSVKDEGNSDVAEDAVAKRKRGRPPSKCKSDLTKVTKMNEETSTKHNYIFNIKTSCHAQDINSLHVSDRSQVKVGVGIESYAKAKSKVENIPQSTGSVNEINSDETTSDMVNLLRQVLAEENYEMKLIEQIFSDPHKIKQLRNSLKDDITGLVSTSKKEKEHLKSATIPTASEVLQLSTRTPVPCLQTLEIVAETKYQNDVVITSNSIKVDPTMKTVSPEVFRESRVSKSAEKQKVSESKSRVSIINDSGKISESVNRISGFVPKSFNSLKEPRQIFVKMTVPISDFEVLVYFAHFGLVVNVQTHFYSVPSWNSAGYAFVTFNSVETVQELLQKPNRDIFGKRVRISQVKVKNHNKSYSCSSPRLVSNVSASSNRNRFFDSPSGSRSEFWRRFDSVSRRHAHQQSL